MRNGERNLSSSDNELSKDPKISLPNIVLELFELQRQLLAMVHEQNAMLINQQQQLIEFLSQSVLHPESDEDRPTSFLDGTPIR